MLVRTFFRSLTIAETFIDLIEIVATMAQPTTTTAATASSTALATTTITLATTTVTRISSEAKTALRNYFIEG